MQQIDPHRVQAVVFDLGGVFLKSGVPTARSFGTRHGLTEAAWQEVYHAMFLQEREAVVAAQGRLEREAAWNAVERGEQSLAWFGQEMAAHFARHGVTLDPALAMQFMGSPADKAAMPLRTEIVRACLRLRQVLPTALLTNNIREWRAGWQSRVDTAALFDVVLDSSELGVRKPEPRIYQIAEQRLGLPGAALLFIDDLGVNLKPARQRGWQTLKYEDTATVLEVLGAVARAREAPHLPT